MANTDILNPSATSPLNPDYAYAEGLPDMFLRFRPRSGRGYLRRLDCQGRTYQLAWSDMLASTARQLRQWEAHFESGYFSFIDWERGGRYFSGAFDGPLEYSPLGNNRWGARGRFVEIPGLPMVAYPSGWAADPFDLTVNRPGDSIPVLPTDDFAGNPTKQVGTWTFTTFTGAPFGSEWRNDNINVTDTLEIQYFGYGFRLWTRTGPALGILKLSFDFDQVTDGFLDDPIDLYSASSVDSVAFEFQDFPLRLHRVKIAATNTKNAASTAKIILFCGLEVMR